uniref:Uncharacterized protein n=1 Tax=viral metagenome TaxID=1070528 RepID=A0A6M3IUZ8_9ZZZZ
MRVVKRISNLKIIYFQFPDFEKGAGIKSAIKLYGGTESDYIEADGEYVYEKTAADLLRENRDAAIIDNLPSWAVVENAISNIANLVDAKVFILKLARVVYWLAKNQKD